MKIWMLAVLMVGLAGPALAGGAADWPSPLNEGEYTPAELKKYVMVAEEVFLASLDGSRIYGVEQNGLTAASGGTTQYSARVGDKREYVYVTTFSDEVKGFGVSIARYRKTGPRGSTAGEGLIEEKAHYFTDFAPVTVELARTASRKTVLRLTPFIGALPPRAEAYDGKRLRLDGYVIKNGKSVVARGVSASGRKITLSPPELGRLEVALSEFPGAKPVGRIMGSMLSFEIGADRYQWLTSAPILPEGTWTVWLKHDGTPTQSKGVSISSGDL